MRYGVSEESDLTKPTITYGSWIFDCDTVTGWTTNSAGITGPSATSDGDVLTLSGAPNTGGDDYIIKYKDISASAVNTDVSPKCLVRWKTSVAASGLQAKLVITYTAASGGGNTTTILGFSTSYTVTTVTLTPARIIEQIQFIGDDNPDALTGGATSYSVYFDFVMFCQGIFPFPFVSGGVELEGFNNYQHLKIPGKVGNATQYLGGDDSTIRVYGDIDGTGTNAAGVPLVGEGWHGRWTTHDGETFYQILHYGWNEAWQWFTSDVVSLKVVVDRVRISQARTDENLLSYDLYLHEYRLGSAGVETNLERFGIT